MPDVAAEEQNLIVRQHSVPDGMLILGLVTADSDDAKGVLLLDEVVSVRLASRITAL